MITPNCLDPHNHCRRLHKSSLKAVSKCMGGVTTCTCLALTCLSQATSRKHAHRLPSTAFMHAAYNNDCENQGNMEGSFNMPLLATTCWPKVVPVPAQPPTSMEDLMSMLLISSNSMSLGIASPQVRQRHPSQLACHNTWLPLHGCPWGPCMRLTFKQIHQVKLLNVQKPASHCVIG